MKLYDIVIKKIIEYIYSGVLEYKSINKLDINNCNNLQFDIYNLDLEIWKKKFYYCLVDIESINWEEVEILYPFFCNNTFQPHYSDIIIKTTDEIKIIYQYHNPNWKIYFDKAIKFPF